MHQKKEKKLLELLIGKPVCINYIKDKIYAVIKQNAKSNLQFVFL
jgi:hypothetical protein